MHELLMLATAKMPMKAIDVNGPYLQRYFWKENEDGSQMWLHRFLRDDTERHLHSHPGTALSTILTGSYVEETPDCLNTYWVGEFNVLSRDKWHRIISIEPNTWTLMHVQKDWLEAEDWYFRDHYGNQTRMPSSPADWWKDCSPRSSIEEWAEGLDW
jgi:hypothetical protein